MATLNKTTVKLPVINYERLSAKDSSEVEKLVQACQAPPDGHGFFLLDIQGPLTKQALEEAPDIRRATTVFFQDAKDLKMLEFRDVPNRGYKPPTMAIQSYEINRAEDLQGKHKYPMILRKYGTQYSSLSSTLDSVAKNLVSILCSKLNLAVPPSANPSSNTGGAESGLKIFHINPDAKPGTQVSEAQKYAGFLSILFYDQPTVELALPGKDQWELVGAQEGCVLVYLGDALEALSGGKLHSRQHRSVQGTDKGIAGICYATYSLRP